MSIYVKLTLVWAVLLIVLGVGFYVGTGAESFTALIPGAFGVLLGVCGLVGMRPTATKHAMHAAAVIALLGLLGSLRVFPNWSEMPAGARWEHVLMLILFAVLLGIYIRSFVAARRGPAEGASKGAG